MLSNSFDGSERRATFLNMAISPPLKTNNMKLIKLSSDHYIIVDDSEIKEGDWMFLEQGNTPATKQGGIAQCMFPNADDDYEWVVWKKITHSTKPIEPYTYDEVGEEIYGYEYGKIQPLSLSALSKVKELLGEVDVEKRKDEYLKKVKEEVKDYVQHDRIYILGSSDLAFTEGYNQALEDNKDKKYTEKDLRAVFMHGFLLGVDRGDYSLDMENRALSTYTQPPTQWDVEFVDGKLKIV